MSLENFEKARGNYLESRKIKVALSDYFWRFVSFFRFQLAFILAIALTCIGCLMMAHGADVPQGIVSAIAAVETGTNWDGQKLTGKFTKGKSGELSPFQLMPSTLKDLGCKNINEVHKHPSIAADYCKKYLAELFERHGNWPEAISRYNAGSRYRSATAKDYAQRVLNLAELTN